jgi:hypothetical protein
MVVGCSQILALLFPGFSRSGPPSPPPRDLDRVAATGLRHPLAPLGPERPEQPVVTAYRAATPDGRRAAGVRVTLPETRLIIG